MEQIFVREVTLADVETLQQISQRTFYETFAGKNTAEDMAKYLEENLSLHRLTAELEDANSLFYFAVSSDKIAGYLKLNIGQSQTELKDVNALEIERIYVLKEFQGKRVGQLLYETALQTARQRQTEYIWLGVWEENHKAISFYEKNGFVEFSRHIFKLGNDEQTDIMMKLPLQ